jgi:hypothetical protein
MNINHEPLSFAAGFWPMKYETLQSIGRVIQNKKEYILLLPKKGMRVMNITLRKRILDDNCCRLKN